jgi:hypothetical protein
VKWPRETDVFSFHVKCLNRCKQSTNHTTGYDVFDNGYREEYEILCTAQCLTFFLIPWNKSTGEANVFAETDVD